MRHFKLVSFVTLLLVGAIAIAKDQAVDDKPALYAKQSAIITALVEAIDHETRVVTLRGPAGNSVTFTASEEARNLGQVSVGDVVRAEYELSVSIKVVAGGGVEPGAGELAAVGRSKKGEMPGVAAFDTKVVTATVESINFAANTFKLRGPDGAVTEYAARNPENLKKAAVGDLVIIKTTEAIALVVEKTTAE